MPEQEPTRPVTHPVALGRLADQLATEAAGASAGRAARTILGGSDSPLRQTVIAMRGGTSLDDHDSPPAASLQVVSGQVVLRTEDERWELAAGDAIMIPRARHGVDATADAVVLLTVATGTG